MPLSPEEYNKWYYTKRGKYISGLEKEVLLRMINPPSPPFSKGGLGGILDIGCGTGYFTQFLSSYCRSIVGVDTSMDMIKYAMKKREDRSQKTEVRIKYIVADAESLPFKDGSFDISVSITAVNFFKNPARAVSEAVRISRKKVFLGILNRWSLLYFFKKVKSFFINTSYSDACFYGERDMVNILSLFPQIKGVYKQHTYFLPFPKIHLILSKMEGSIPSWFPFGGFMGIVGEKEGRIR
ncbi:MAG: hypothetical protein A2889_02805 [Nitrospinae bacterium RIFCSPLOWO2_01_FULL_39_10]|nr:MAG: hypothetical protein A2889_02805 [Nitrospinae bacterium RIFCSPLOWO2_01_FULL_39_10]